MTPRKEKVQKAWAIRFGRRINVQHNFSDIYMTESDAYRELEKYCIKGEVVRIELRILRPKKRGRV